MPRPLEKTIYVGTAGWSYKDWEGTVYPRGAPKSFDRLAFISSLFDLVEVNVTYYRIVPRATAASWLERTEPSFLFSIKLHQSFTHAREGSTPRDEREMKLLLDTVMAEGRLAALLAQFPQSFHNTEENRRKIARLAETFRDYPLALEVRHFSWGKGPVPDFFSSLGAALVNIDQPEIRGLLGPSSHVTSDFAYFRFHGRNKNSWFSSKGGVDARYDYLYSQEELVELKDGVESAAKRAERTLVVFNNHYRGKAAAGGLMLARMLGKPAAARPDGIRELFPDEPDASPAGKGPKEP